MSAALHAVVPAAGAGSRMKTATPKQYLQLDGMTLLERSVRVLLQVPAIESVTVALGDAADERLHQSLFADARVSAVPGGAERSDSVLAALRAVNGRADDWVLVHDAARPCLDIADVGRLVMHVLDTGEGAILAEPIVDTVKRVDATGRVEQTLDRRQLWRAQTPQMFRLGELQQALQQCRAAKLAVTDEASAMEQAGYPVQVVAGSPGNIKVTLPGDLALAQWHLSQQGEPS